MTDQSPADNQNYPMDLVDGTRMDRIVRHRLRNFCAGMRMAVSIIHDKPGLADDDRARCGLMLAEMDDLQRFSDRLSLLFGPPLPQEAGTVTEVMATAQAEFSQAFPLCSLDLQGPLADTPVELPAANWVALVLRELLRNAAEAAGRDGSVKLFWALSPTFRAGVASTGTALPDSIPRFPFRPFNTTRNRHDGIGLAIIQRYCELLGYRLVMSHDVPGALVFLIGADQGDSHHA